MKRNNRLLKISGWTREELWMLKCDLERIEGKKISMGEVVERVLKGSDIKKRLKIGAVERKNGIR